MSKKSMNAFTEREAAYMHRALDLAKKGLGRTWPNPAVGAVVVKNGKIIGEGFHRAAGQPHAEVEALRGLSRKDCLDATLYVTLEPCAHTNKRTPPCANYLINSGIKSLVAAMRDPNKFVNGKGFEVLLGAGVKVRVGLLSEEARMLNEVYCKTISTSLPFVALKMAMSLDGKIAASDGGSRWITGELSRRHVHELRTMYDAVLTSSETVLNDDPHLGVRMVKGRDPLRIVIDRRLKTDPAAKVYRDANVLLVTTTVATAAKIKLFRRKKIDMIIYPPKFTLRMLMKDLRKRNIGSLMIEAGGTIAASFVKEKLVDKFLFFIAPKIIGGDGKDSVGELGIRRIEKAFKLRHISVGRFGEDLFVEAYPSHVIR